MEKCRELSYEILTLLVDRLNIATWANILPCIFPILVQRLSQQELVESSEEVRLLALNFMHKLVRIFTTSAYKGNYKTVVFC